MATIKAAAAVLWLAGGTAMAQEDCQSWLAKTRDKGVKHVRPLMLMEYTGLIEGIPQLRGGFGEDHSDWPDFKYLTSEEADSIGLKTENALAMSYPPQMWPNNTDRPMVVITEKIFNVACNSNDVRWVMVHELAHHRPRRDLMGRGENHMGYLKERKKDLFEKWWKAHATWWFSEKAAPDPYVQEWMRKNRNKSDASPLSDKKIFEMAWKDFLAARRHLLQTDSQAIEDEADAEATQFLTAKIEKFGGALGHFTRKEAAEILRRMHALEAKIHIPEGPYKTHKDSDKRALQLLDRSVFNEVLANWERRSHPKTPATFTGRE